MYDQAPDAVLSNDSLVSDRKNKEENQQYDQETPESEKY